MLNGGARVFACISALAGVLSYRALGGTVGVSLLETCNKMLLMEEVLYVLCEQWDRGHSHATVST